MANLTTGSPGAAIDTSSATSKDLPAWYQQYTSNLAGQGAQVAAANNAEGVPQASVAGFNPTQTQAFDQVQANQGAYKPGLAAATSTNAQIAPAVTGAVANANAAVAGPAQTWGDSAATKYMSPYTSNVTDSISKLADQNWNNNIMPGINSSMIGNGQFGSTRNADVLGQAAANEQAQVTGAQSGALQAGYTGAQAQFNTDQARAQTQGQIQANTALTGANTSTNGLNTAATGALTLAQGAQTMGNTDAQSTLNIGNQQQTLQQTGLNADTANATAVQQAPWTQLNNQAGLMNGVQLPSTVTTTNNGPASSYSPSPLSGALSTYFMTQGLNSNGTAPVTTTGAK